MKKDTVLKTLDLCLEISTSIAVLLLLVAMITLIYIGLFEYTNNEIQQSEPCIPVEQEVVKQEPIKNEVVVITLDEDTQINHHQTDYFKLKAFMNYHDLTKHMHPDTIYSLSLHYQIDPGFALATFILETGWGKSTLWTTGNNPAGINCGGQYCTYESPFYGFEAMYQRLEQYTDGTVAYIGTKRSIKDVRDTWSATNDTAEIIRIWNMILDFE